MIILINFGSTAPNVSELDDITNSCSCDVWEHVMIGMKDKTPEQLAHEAANIVYKTTLDQFNGD